jgi:glycogen synthase
MSETVPTFEQKTRAAEQAAAHETLLPAHHETAATNHKVESVAERHAKASEAAQTAHHEAHNHNPLEQLQAAETAAAAPTRHMINKELKDVTLRRELQHIQRHESPVVRRFSRLVHQPAIRVVSETAGKTVSRPSGLLGGGLVAFLGTSTYLYLANHIGFTYNSGVFIALFAGGFILGLCLELAVHLATASRRKVD